MSLDHEQNGEGGTGVSPVAPRAECPCRFDDLEQVGRWLHALVTELYPLCRSITGPGLRQTLSLLARHVPLEIHEVPTGTPVFDWCIPREWSIRDAWIRDAAGRKIVDFQQSNLHVVGYSTPVHEKLSRAELLPHLHSLPEHPDWIPYRTSYYHEAWGFCLPHRQLADLPDQQYEVLIDSTLAAGSLTYGECYLPGESDEEFLFSCHVCHPSLASDNLSGVAVATLLARRLLTIPRRYSYRFLFAPGTIGAITWLARNEAVARRIRHGLVLALLGDPGRSTYKKSRRGDAEIDRAMLHVLAHSGQDYAERDFEPLGYDERQYGSPGFDLPVGCLMRSPPDLLPEYHTSADNPELVRPEALADSWAKCLAVVELLENNRAYLNQSPKCEPQLGRRGLYRSFGGGASADLDRAILWALNLSDGRHSLLDVAERSKLSFPLILQAAKALEQCGLLVPQRKEPP
jgi:aminopeptidase-like protein